MENSNVYKKWAIALKTITPLVKSGFNKQDGFQYDEADAVLEHIRPILGEIGLIIEHHIVSQEYVREPNQAGGMFNQVTRRYRLVDADNPDSRTEWAEIIGQATEYKKSADKGFAMADTYCLKNMVKDIFLLRGKDDEDTDKAKEGADTPANFSGNQPGSKKLISFPKSEAPKQQKQEGEQPLPASPPAAPAQQIADTSKTSKVFVAELKALGYELDEAKAILRHFGRVGQDNKLSYTPANHDQMLREVKAWKTLQGNLFSESPSDFLINYGFVVPFTEAQVKESAPFASDYEQFAIEATKVSPEWDGILAQYALFPWRSDKSDLMLETLRNHVNPPVTQVEDIFEEKAAVEDVAVADDDESDELSDILAGASMKL